MESSSSSLVIVEHSNIINDTNQTEELYMSSKIVVIIYSILFIISSIGNTTVFISLIKNRHRKLRINLMILNLTIADLIVTYIMIPMEICWRITNEWLAGDVVCRIMQAFRAFGPYLSSMVLVCISLDRYFAVIHPMKVNDAQRRSKIMLTFAWLTSIACSVPQTIVFHTESHPQYPDFVQCVSYNSLTERQEILYSTFGIAALYLIPLVIIIFCYARIIWEIYKRSIQSSKEKSRIRTLRMTIIIVMAFVWCWTPYASIVLLYHFYKPQVENMPKDLKDALFMFAVSNSCVNPLVYGSYTMNFRQHCCNFLRKLSFWKRKTVNLPQSNHSIYLDDQTSYSGLNTSTPLYQNNYNNNSMMTDHQSLDSSCYSAKFCPTDD
ncbi:gonadotropin-releasing hormone receptor-like [Dermatophagoides farinae]|uniref:Gonadotropin-releasing hormone receptor-like n=1 Tax=Dermatophagoides farinae TaxID=6954 RepID=A0A9D4P288_DERFA|nr:gonadotropin-releasing hormone receptor-like [Dermatophagoides farinae]